MKMFLVFCKYMVFLFCKSVGYRNKVDLFCKLNLKYKVDICYLLFWFDRNDIIFIFCLF